MRRFATAHSFENWLFEHIHAIHACPCLNSSHRRHTTNKFVFIWHGYVYLYASIRWSRGPRIHDRRTHKQTKSYHTYICISNYRYVRTYVCMCVSAHIVKITRYLFPRDFANTLLAQDTLCCAVRKAPLNLQGLLCASVEWAGIAATLG